MFTARYGLILYVTRTNLTPQVRALLSSRRTNLISVPSPCEIYFGPSVIVIVCSPSCLVWSVSNTPLKLHTHLQLHVALPRGTDRGNLGTFQTKFYFGRGSAGYKRTFNFCLEGSKIISTQLTCSTVVLVDLRCTLLVDISCVSAESNGRFPHAGKPNECNSYITSSFHSRPVVPSYSLNSRLKCFTHFTSLPSSHCWVKRASLPASQCLVKFASLSASQCL